MRVSIQADRAKGNEMLVGLKTLVQGIANAATRNGRPPNDRISKWLIDSGASFHIVSINNIDGTNGRVRPAKTPRRVETVVGNQLLDKEADVNIPLLKDIVPVKTSTDILSLGLLCRELGVQVRLGAVPERTYALRQRGYPDPTLRTARRAVRIPHATSGRHGEKLRG